MTFTRASASAGVRAPLKTACPFPPGSGTLEAGQARESSSARGGGGGGGGGAETFVLQEEELPSSAVAWKLQVPS